MAKKTRTTLRKEIKDKYFEEIFNYFKERGEDVIQVKSNEFAFPVVDSEGNEDSVVIVVKVPTGANKGTEPYDPYSMGEEYQIKQKDKAEKAEAAAKKKAEKIAKDTARREAEAEIKAKRNGE